MPHFLIKFKGLDAPETARKLTGSEILVGRDRAASLGENEFYIADLIGCALVLSPSAEAAVVSPVKPTGKTSDEPAPEAAPTRYEPGSDLGTVVEVWDNSADDLLTVKLTMGKIVQVPFRAPFIGKVDIEARSVELLTAWLLD